MKAINDFVSKCTHDGHGLLKQFPSLKKIIFTSSIYPAEILQDYANERKEAVHFDEHESRLVLPVSVCSGRVVVNIISEKCEPQIIYKPKE